MTLPSDRRGMSLIWMEQGAAPTFLGGRWRLEAFCSPLLFPPSMFGVRRIFSFGRTTTTMIRAAKLLPNAVPQRNNVFTSSPPEERQVGYVSVEDDPLFPLIARGVTFFPPPFLFLEAQVRQGRPGCTTDKGPFFFRRPVNRSSSPLKGEGDTVSLPAGTGNAFGTRTPSTPFFFPFFRKDRDDKSQGRTFLVIGLFLFLRVGEGVRFCTDLL